MSLPFRAREWAWVPFTSCGAIADAPLLPYLSALDQTFKGFGHPVRFPNSTHVVLCFSGLDPKGMWALCCLSFGYLDIRNRAL